MCKTSSHRSKEKKFGGSEKGTEYVICIFSRAFRTVKMASNMLRDEIREAVRQEVTRLFSTSSLPTQSIPAVTTLSESRNYSSESSCERADLSLSTSATPQAQSTSSTPCGSSSARSNRTLSFQDFYKMRERQRQAGFKSPKNKAKGSTVSSQSASKKPANVEIKVGIASQTDGVMKTRRGKTHVITVHSSATKEEIVQKAVEKHSSFDQSFDNSLAYVLLYPDYKEVFRIPGTTRPFTLSDYKQAIGKDYKRLTFYLIPLDDVMESSDESGKELSPKSTHRYSDIRRYGFTQTESKSNNLVINLDDIGSTSQSLPAGELKELGGS